MLFIGEVQTLNLNGGRYARIINGIVQLLNLIKVGFIPISNVSVSLLFNLRKLD